MRTDIEEKVLEKLATGDKATIVVERQSNGKMRVTSGSWDGETVILRDQCLSRLVLVGAIPAFERIEVTALFQCIQPFALVPRGVVGKTQ
jgi:hypothetical protein